MWQLELRFVNLNKVLSVITGAKQSVVTSLPRIFDIRAHGVDV